MARTVLLSGEQKVRREALFAQLDLLNDLLNPEHTRAMHHRRGEVFDELRALGVTREDLAEHTRRRGLDYSARAVDWAVQRSRALNAESPQENRPSALQRPRRAGRPSVAAVAFVDRLLEAWDSRLHEASG